MTVIYIQLAVDIILPFVLLALSIHVCNVYLQKYEESRISRLSIAFAFFSLVSLFGIILPAFFPLLVSRSAWAYLIFALLSILGFVASVLATLLGLFSFRRDKTHLAIWSIILGIVMFVIFYLAGGSPLLCINDNACHLAGQSCVSAGAHISSVDIPMSTCRGGGFQ
jgi:hypothetical protein